MIATRSLDGIGQTNQAAVRLTFEKNQLSKVSVDCDEYS
jgi:hypothetical protein